MLTLRVALIFLLLSYTLFAARSPLGDFPGESPASVSMGRPFSGGNLCWRLGDERRKREDRGAKGAEGGRCGEGCPLSTGEESGEGAVPPP